jgi:hypothetical protein
MAMTDLCPSCREPLDYPSGDGCAAMTKHQPHQYPSPEAIVRAALERASDGLLECSVWCDSQEKADISWRNGVTDARKHHRERIRSLASNPAEVAAIIKNAAGEDRG